MRGREIEISDQADQLESLSVHLRQSESQSNQSRALGFQLAQLVFDLVTMMST